MPQRLQITFDAADPPALARFWAEALGYVEQPPPPGFDTWEAFAVAHDMPPEAIEQYAALIDPDGVGPRIFMQQVPEGKTAKNRVHLDVSAPEGAAGTDRVDVVRAFAAHLVEQGATRVEEHDKMGEQWVVLQDPEGNEFCVV